MQVSANNNTSSSQSADGDTVLQCAAAASNLSNAESAAGMVIIHDSDHSSPHPPPSSARSVGQRIKEASLNNTQVSPNAGANGNSSTPHQRHNRTSSALCASGALIDGCAAALNQLGSARSQQQAGGVVAQLAPLHLTDAQRNTIRIIGQYLRDLGMSDTVESLVEESGCRIENSLSMRLRDYITAGEWQKALDVVEKLRPTISDRQYLTVRVLLLEEKFKHLLSKGEFLHALHLLQTEYPREREFRARQEHLATLLMSSSDGGSQSPYFIVDFLEQQDKEKNSEQVLKVLHKILPPSMMLPPSRLEELLKQSWQYQMKNCDLHLRPIGDRMDEQAILKDHRCSMEDFPSHCSQVLSEHGSEVWCLEFSPCGRYLASGAKSSTVIVWRVESPQRVLVYRRMQIPQDVSGIASLSWSQDGHYLAICSTEDNSAGAFIYNVQKGVCVKEYKHFPSDSFAVVSFFKNDSHRLAAGSQKGHFVTYDVHKPEDSPRLIEGFRIRCLYSMRDGKTVLAADTHNRIRRYDFETLNESNLITETSLIMYFTVDREERHCLVTTKTEGLRLWCLKTRCLLRSFFGSVHSEFVITSSFGGAHNNFIASGSEDEQVVIWNTEKSEPVRRLIGHTGTVNAVSWNQKHHGMLASGSDDGTIRIWSTKARLTQ